MPLPRSRIGSKSKDRDFRVLRTALNIPALAPGMAIDHGALGGLGDDDHSQYAHLAQSETVAGQYFFDPASVQAPFLIGTNAQSQLVAGLRADELNKQVISGNGLIGGGTLTADVTLNVGEGNGLTVNVDDVTLTTPTANLSVSSTNLVDVSGHQHAINSSAAPGAVSTLLKTDSSGYLQILKIGLGVTPTAPLHVSGTASPQVRLEYGASDYADLIISADGSIEIQTTGGIIFDPDGQQVNPEANYDVNLGQINKKYLTLHAAELWVETLVAQDTIATIGGRILVGPTTALTTDLGTGGTTIYVKHNQMANNDIVYLEADGKVEFMEITSVPSGTGPYSYTVARNLDGTGANQWYAGDAVFNTGVTGNGFIDLYSISSVTSGINGLEATTGPTIVGNVRYAHATPATDYNKWVEHWAIGNLKGLYGYGSDTYGVGLGRYGSSNEHLVVTGNAIRFYNYATEIASWVGSTITLGNAGTENIQVSSTAIDLRNGITSYANLTGSTLRLGPASGERIVIDSNSIDLYDGGGLLRLQVTASQIVVGRSSEGEYLRIDSGGIDFIGGGVQRGGLSSAGTFWFGDASNSEHIRWDATNGLQIRNASNVTVIKLPTSGNAQIIGTLDVTSPGIITAGAGAIRLGAAGIEFKANSAEIPSGASVNSIDWYDTAFSSLYAWVEASHDTITSNWNRLQLQVEPYGTSGDAYIALLSTGFNVTRIEMFADLVRIDDLLFINETANSKQTEGITIKVNTGGSGYEAITLKDDGLTNVFSTITETDTWFYIRERTNAGGGAVIEGFGNAAEARPLVLVGNGGTAGTGTGTGTNALIEAIGKVDNGAGAGAAVGSTGNLFLVSNNGTVRFIFKGDGKLYCDVTQTVTDHASHVYTYDEYDDIKLLAGARGMTLPTETDLRSGFNEFVEYARPILESTEVIKLNDGQYGNDNDGSVFMNIPGMVMLQNDAIRQQSSKQNRRHDQMVARMDMMEAALLEEGIEIPQLHGGL